MKNSVTYKDPLVLRQWKQGGEGGLDMPLGLGRPEKHTKFLWRNILKSGHLYSKGDGRKILRW